MKHADSYGREAPGAAARSSLTTPAEAIPQHLQEAHGNNIGISNTGRGTPGNLRRQPGSTGGKTAGQPAGQIAFAARKAAISAVP